ncbi:GNAT family N-acetyltransferase [Allokutzneria albata]|uniref:Acetyltransferase (GNAT) domain-containing protein n=1 Tax=Allokutzneria albata TaxID=211114 RepID=A0A1G9TXZ1_ALLAB|nr:hypothetical protein [Allokutzneria albata]SDM52640.1 hypothetical protein SAMN04489726_2063 [Allokutzneria albata]
MGRRDDRRAHLAATDLFAGVAHGNARSVAVLLRLGFSRVASFDDYDRYHLDLVRCSGIRQVLG